jgi:PEP-CTERM motif-containing protein
MQMSLSLRIVLTSFSFCALLGSSAANGDTVLKLSLGNTGPDLAMNAGGVLGTTSDGNAGTTGDQDTAIDYTGFLNPLFADGTGSFSVAGLLRTGPPNVIGGAIIVQDFDGGAFDLYSSTNTLLLHGNLTESTLTGVIGGTGTGSIFTTQVGNFTAGTLLPFVHPSSLNVSMALTNVNGGLGFVVSGSPSTLQAFTTDAAVNISAEPGPGIPEPSSIAIALLGAAGFSFIGRRRRA